MDIYNITKFIPSRWLPVSPPPPAPSSTLLIDSVAAKPGQHELNQIEPGIPLLRNAAFFTEYLTKLNFKHAFSDTGYDTKTSKNSYDKALIQLRLDVKNQNTSSAEQKKIAQKLMTAPLLIPSVAMMANVLDLDPKTPKSPLSQQWQTDRVSILQSPFSKWNLFEGPLRRTFLKFCSIINVFDAHRNGNLSFLVGNRYLNGKKVTLLRHAVPTVERGPCNIEISGEYRAFLSDCREKNHKVLYCALLNPSSRNEQRRLDKLKELTNAEQKTFHLIRFPLDGVLCRENPHETLEEYTASIRRHMKASLENSSSWKGEFFFSPAVSLVVKDVYEKILDFCLQQITDVYAKEKQSGPQDLQEKKQALMMLFCSLLRQSLIARLEINYYNNTCKDGIDRGAAHMLSDLLWDSFMTGRLKENYIALRVLTAWPAFMAKTQPVLPKRLQWVQSLASWIEKAEKQHVRSEISQKCLKTLGLEISKGIRFDNRQITLMQGGA